jgi:hypothetical protein
MAGTFCTFMRATASWLPGLLVKRRRGWSLRLCPPPLVLARELRDERGQRCSTFP